MKKLLISAVLAIVASTVFASHYTGDEKSTANVNAPVTLNYEGKGKVTLRVLTASEGKVSVKIFGKGNHLIHDETISYEKSFKIPFDLSTQEAGYYRFVIDGTDLHHVESVFLGTLSNEDVYATITHPDTDLVNIKVLHNDVPVTISIYNQWGEKVYTETYHQKNNFQQQFNLQEFRGQDMKISISGNKSFLTFNI